MGTVVPDKGGAHLAPIARVAAGIFDDECDRSTGDAVPRASRFLERPAL
jgi:hypothetical protein